MVCAEADATRQWIMRLFAPLKFAWGMQTASALNGRYYKRQKMIHVVG
jgi:hypothetical protein